MKAPSARLDLARVRLHRPLHPGFRHLQLAFPGDYPTPLPGQYLNLRVSAGSAPLFRRPFGVAGFRREDGVALVDLYYGVVGRGTTLMSRWREGDAVDCLGPSGKPFRVDPSRAAVLVAGGRGAAPLLYLHRRLRETGHNRIRFAMGAASGDLLFGLDEVPEADRLIATEDGSRGFPGTVVEALEQARPEWLSGDNALYACGPDGLLRAAARLAESRGLPCQVSLEGVYGCGLGLCRGCAVPLRGEEGFLLQCVEGPVVDAARIDWEKMPRE